MEKKNYWKKLNCGHCPTFAVIFALISPYDIPGEPNKQNLLAHSGQGKSEKEVRSPLAEVDLLSPIDLDWPGKVATKSSR